jgi:hypothetical protein
MFVRVEDFWRCNIGIIYKSAISLKPSLLYFTNLAGDSVTIPKWCSIVREGIIIGLLFILQEANTVHI